MRVGNEQVIDEIVFLDRRRLLAAPAAPLRAVVGQRLRLDVAAVRQRHHHVLRRDEVFDPEILRIGFNLGPTLVAELGTNRCQFFDDDLADPLRPRQDVHEVGDFLEQLGKIRNDLVALQTCQALQAQFKNRLRLSFRE